MKPPQPGTTVDERFALEEALAEEYGATLYRARDVLLGRQVAFRLLRKEVFSQEVRAQNLLQLQRSRAFVHHNIVTVHDVVCKADIAYVASDWVEGVSLAEQVKTNGRFDTETIIALLGDLKDALEWVHQIAECGRLNPGNLIVDNGRLVLTEPYFLRVAGSDEQAWSSFLAPEQLEAGWSGGPKADFYAAAMLVGYLFVGGEVQPGLALSKQTDRSTPQLDAAFVVATQSNPTLRVDGLSPLLEALQAIGSDAAVMQDADTVEFRSIFTPEPESNPTDTKPSFEFVEPEGLEARDPGLQKSVDRRLHQEPKRRRQDTIELDLTDESVTVVKDTALTQAEYGQAGLEGVPEGIDALPADTVERKLSAFNPDRENPGKVPIEGDLPSTNERGATETDQFQMVSDKAVFDDSSLPSRSGSRDEYDTLESGVSEQPVEASGVALVSPETQALQRPGVKPARPKSNQGGATASVVFLVVVLALGIAAYVTLRDNSYQAALNGHAKTDAGARPISTSSPKLSQLGTAVRDADAFENTGGDVHVEEQPTTDVTANDDVQDSSTSASQVAEDASSEVSGNGATESAGAQALPPATDRKQFTCNAFDMALITKRKTVSQADGSSIKIISKAYCVDKYEYPGKGAIPHTNVSLSQARQGCNARGRRLCSASEWRGACGAKYPYRGAYEPGRCNAMVELGSVRPITPAGTFSRCKSGWGTYDMVGNVAEWTSAGNIHGGSYQLDGEEASCNRKRTRLDPSPKVGYRCCADAKRKDLK